MPVISPNAQATVIRRFAPPEGGHAQGLLTLPPMMDLRERVRRLERAHSAQRPDQGAVPTGLAAIDALLPEGGLLTECRPCSFAASALVYFFSWGYFLSWKQ